MSVINASDIFSHGRQFSDGGTRLKVLQSTQDDILKICSALLNVAAIILDTALGM